jgi:glycosyltransferase involved in cell wall biosynthesis
MSKFPRITIVTPSFNQAAFLERTILSVLGQGYPNLEYFIVDGGSTDGSVDIIRKYSDQVAWWVSEPDGGQTEAINKGLRRATGDWVAWQNSDDIYYPGAFHDMVAAASRRPKAELIVADMMLIDEYDRPLRDIRYVTPSYNAMRAEGMLIANQAAFWRRGLQEKVGLLDETFDYSFDYEWFLRLLLYTESVHVSKIWGAFRLHGDTKTSTQAQLFQEENLRILAGRELPAWRKPLYKLRRLALMLSRGQLGYVLRGISCRTRRHYGKFC